MEYEIVDLGGSKSVKPREFLKLWENEFHGQTSKEDIGSFLISLELTDKSHKNEAIQKLSSRKYHYKSFFINYHFEILPEKLEKNSPTTYRISKWATA